SGYDVNDIKTSRQLKRLRNSLAIAAPPRLEPPIILASKYDRPPRQSPCHLPYSNCLPPAHHSHLFPLVPQHLDRAYLALFMYHPISQRSRSQTCRVTDALSNHAFDREPSYGLLDGVGHLANR
ncbi:unnamed protein product, partial [Rhizoctonia solani]